MVISGFSKVSADLLDEEDDERQQIVDNARSLYEAAQSDYNRKGTKEEVLRLFEKAEEAMKPLLGAGGLVCLAMPELEFVLKGRLHQAVIIAQLENYPSKWTKVKGLAEEILHFDCSNCHARWLRGQSLIRIEEKRSDEAIEEMNRAVEYARKLGKATEAAQWEMEIQQMEQANMDGIVEDVPTAKPEAEEPSIVIEDLEEVEEEVPAKEKLKASATEKLEAPAAEKPRPPAKAPAVQKGFFNRKSQKAQAPGAPATSAAAATWAAPELAPPAGAATGAESLGASAVEPQARATGTAAQSAALQLRQAREAELQRQRDVLQEELEDMRRKLWEERDQRIEDQKQLEAQRSEGRRQLEDWQNELTEGLDTIGAEFEAAVEEQPERTAGGDAAAVDQLRSAVAELEAQFQASRTWSESQHQRLLDFSTEVVTLRELAGRELRERQDFSKQQVSEVRELVGRMGELRAAVKSLRDHVKRKVGTAQRAEAEQDLHQLADDVASFHGLPTSVKVAAMLDDAAVMRLMILAALLGMIFMLGTFTQFFALLRCRFLCAL